MPNNTTYNPQGDNAWATLGEILDAFSEAWETSPPATLDTFIPPPHVNLRTLALIELIKLDMEFRARTPSLWQPLQHYVDQWPEIKLENQIPPDLILEEIRLCEETDRTVRADEFLHQYPSYAAQLSQLLDSETEAQKTISFSRARHIHRYRPGMTVDDFDLLTQLGQGAFATVFLARQNSMQRLVALKISADEGLEPQTLAQLDHPNIVRVYDQRVLPEKKIRLMYMQFVAGGSLAEILAHVHQVDTTPSGRQFLDALDQILISKGQSVAPPSPGRKWLAEAEWPEVVARIGSQLADALHYAHQNGVLHRDLKPANILLDADGAPKIVDFNISFSDKIAGATPASYFGGSLAFMSPEQLEATSTKHARTPDALDGRSDVYALGVVLFEMLTSHYPFPDVQAPDWSQTVPLMIEVRNRGISDEFRKELRRAPFLVQNTITHCIQNRPEDRFSSRSISQQLNWASRKEVTQFLRPESGRLAGVARWINRFPFALVCFLGVTLGLAAGSFIFTYNWIQAVPSEHLDFFDFLRKVINRIAFPLGTFILLWGIWPLRKAIAKIQDKTQEVQPLEKTQSDRGMECALNFPFLFAGVALAEWALAGFLYPIILSWRDIPIQFSGWFDFIISHTLTGLAMASYGFICLLFLSLRFWIPYLLTQSLHLEQTLDWKTHTRRLTTAFRWAQIAAVATPLVAISLLVNLHRTSSSFALGFLSVTALLGLVVLAFVSPRIQTNLDILEELDGD